MRWPWTRQAVTPGWCFVSIGFERHETSIGGVDPWTVEWKSRRQDIIVAHPQYPNEFHAMPTWELAGSDPPIKFAAGEFSNGVWGFFVPS